MRCFLELALRVLSCPLPTRFDRCVDSKCSSEALTAISIFKSIQQQVRYSQIPKRTQHTYTHSDSPKEGREVSALSSIGDTTRFVEIFVFTVWLIVITTLVRCLFLIFSEGHAEKIHTEDFRGSDCLRLRRARATFFTFLWSFQRAPLPLGCGRKKKVPAAAGHPRKGWLSAEVGPPRHVRGRGGDVRLPLRCLRG